MSKYNKDPRYNGVRILNVQAASALEYSMGLRKKMDSKVTLFTPSLFLDFLLDNGLKYTKTNYTRDIIRVDFGYGTKNKDEVISHLKKYQENENVSEWITDTIEKIESNQINIEKVNKKNLRFKIYENGITIPYVNKNGVEYIHYRRLFRSPGAAKRGSVIMIREELWQLANDFICCGTKMPNKNAPIVEMGAYNSLIASSIIDRIRIKPEEILVIKDTDRNIFTDVISIETNSKNQCIAVERNNYKLSTTIFDGQALIDSSIFPDWADGFILLRNHMFKACAFNTHIKKFFMDYYGDKYDREYIEDYFGCKVKVSNIKLITTENACKFIKLGIAFDKWKEKVKDINCLFGIVKTAHASKLDDGVQRMSYQMCSVMDIKDIPKITKDSVDISIRLKSDDEFFIDFLKKKASFCTDYDVLAILAENNPDIINTDFFRKRRKDIIRVYVEEIRSGRLRQNADNLCIVQNPYEMLLHSVGALGETPIVFDKEDNAIQCFTERFSDGEYLAEFRSPFNSHNNLGLLHNVYSEEMKKYFNLGKLCVAVNCMGSSFCDRNNGSDADGDTIYVTNQKEIVERAKYCMSQYKTIVNNIPKSKKTYDNTMYCHALMDNNLASYQNGIGESSNLAQIALSYTYNFSDKKYKDIVCILSVLAQIYIDSAKRSFEIDPNKELIRLRNLLNLDENKYPRFWQVVQKGKGNFIKEEKFNDALVCPMNMIQNTSVPRFRSSIKTTKFSDYIVDYDLNKDNKKKNKRIEELIKKYSIDLFVSNIGNADWILLEQDFDSLIEEIQSIYIGQNYKDLMIFLLKSVFIDGKSDLTKNKSLLIKTLYKINEKVFLECFVNNKSGE